MNPNWSQQRIGYLGPKGTFTEEALLSDPELAKGELLPLSTFHEVFDAIDLGTIDHGFLAIENSIEGTVLATLDSLIFDRDLVITRELVIPIHQQLLARPGVSFTDIEIVYSYPHASAQCRRYLADKLPNASLYATNSTAHGAQMAAGSSTHNAAAIAPRLAASLYGLEILEENIEDFGNNQTRFVLVSPKSALESVEPSGYDKTSVVCFQLQDRPGSLLEILQHFAGRSINLTKLESRPSKKAIGEYCFVIDFVGHLKDPVIQECIADLQRGATVVKVLGTHPIHSESHSATPTKS